MSGILCGNITEFAIAEAHLGLSYNMPDKDYFVCMP